MPTIYISGAISGLEKQYVRNRFDRAEQKLKGSFKHIINPLNLPYIGDGSWESHMKKDIKALMDCDAIYMLLGWKESKGAVCEYELAKLLKIEVLYENE